MSNLQMDKYGMNIYINLKTEKLAFKATYMSG